MNLPPPPLDVSVGATERRWRRLYWTCQIIGWGLYGGVNLLFPIRPPTAAAFVSSFAFSACGLLLSHGLRALVRRQAWLERPIGDLLRRVLGAIFVLAVLMTILAHGYWWLRFVALGDPLAPGEGRWSPAIPLLLMFNMTVMFSLWCGIYFGIAWWRRQERAERARLELQLALADARYETLVAQLNPHFLFNCLNSLRALVTEDPVRTQEAITQLSALLRYTLRTSASGTVTLADEIRIVEAYLALERLRLEERLEVELEVPAAVRPLRVPAMAVLTLVENAIKHGVSREPGRGSIAIRAGEEAGRLILSVRNTGRFVPGERGADSLGVGLRSIRERLEKMFASAGTLTIGDAGGGWVEARLELPARRPDASAAPSGGSDAAIPTLLATAP